MASYLNNSSLPKGIRNNNPGNLVEDGSAWQGKVGVSNGFVQFSDTKYGIRAAAINLSAKFKQGRDTIRTLITAWAPPKENDTEDYIRDVSRQTGFSPDAKLPKSHSALKNILRAIFDRENGLNASRTYITDMDISAGLNMAALKKGLEWMKENAIPVTGFVIAAFFLHGCF